MALPHLMKKTWLRFRQEGLRDALREAVYFKRIMVAVAKDLEAGPSLMNPPLRTIIVNGQNYGRYKKYPGIGNVLHHCRRGACALLLFRDMDLLGYQLWTMDKNFADLKKLGLALKDNEAYLFDLFVYPRYRGTAVPKIIATETFNHLVSRGIDKICGFYFKDNFKALWWHKATLKAREIKQVPTSRLFMVEFTAGRITWKL